MPTARFVIGLKMALAILTMPSFAHARPASTGETILYNFAGGTSDGAHPLAGLVFDAAGNLYGTTYAGGNRNSGTVFELSPDGSGGWTETVLHRFSHSVGEGYGPQDGIIQDSAGQLYGTTTNGGTYGYGTVFELRLQPGVGWKEKVVHSFNQNGTDGIFPVAGLVLDAAGNLYGTTSRGGYASEGTVFELKQQTNADWTENVLYSFKNNATDGKNPSDKLVFDAAGNLYGTTTDGGAYRVGTAFELKREAGGIWKERILYTFVNDGTDGANPGSGLVFDAAGNLYGTTQYGGTSGGGTVFQLSSNGIGGWTEKVLYSFSNNGTDGYYPFREVILDAAGNLYGTTPFGGTSGGGIAFELSPDGSGGWTEKVLHTFANNGTDGGEPVCGLIFDTAGNLYGTTAREGTAAAGTVFEITP
jgi:uncharacterized repeat protein (TIGR03803 family)